jgi:hypothetical protein
MKEDVSISGKIAMALGKGIIAGLAGTAAMSLCQRVEMTISKREPSQTPAKAVGKVLHLKTTEEGNQEQFVNQIHWTYGTLWGLARTVLDLACIKGWQATLLHYETVWGTSLLMLPTIKVTPPVKEWGAKEIATDALHHLVYSVVTGLVYDAIE